MKLTPYVYYLTLLALVKPGLTTPAGDPSDNVRFATSCAIQDFLNFSSFKLANNNVEKSSNLQDVKVDV